MLSTNIILPAFLGIILIVAIVKKVDAYSHFVHGVQDGFGLFNDVFPAMLGMMFSIAMMKESGLLDAVANLFTSFAGVIPKEIFPMMLFRPISGNASLAVMIDIFKTLGVDSFAGQMASIIQGSTDTTLYVITLYFASVGVKKIKNSLAIGLISDLAGITMAILLTFYFFS